MLETKTPRRPKGLTSATNQNSHTIGFTDARQSLYDRFSARISIDHSLSRKLVSYQGNKETPGLRWLKYKEGFSAELVQRLLTRTTAKTVLDPFSGSGTAPLTAASLEMYGTGIEIMPIGNLSARAIAAAANGLQRDNFLQVSNGLIDCLSSNAHDTDLMFQHLPLPNMPSRTKPKGTWPKHDCS